MIIKRILPAALVVIGVALLTGFAASTSTEIDLPRVPDADVESVREAADAVDDLLQSRHAAAGLTPAETADELTVLRRLSLALHGTVPSLEELRRFEGDHEPHRLERWTAAMLEDNRFADYFAERLARAYVGIDSGQFIVFRRDRFTEWLREQLRSGRPYDDMVREMISGDGVWTGEGEVNFVTAAFANDEFDHNELTARTARAFLGQRIDCAQCHDHPFDAWTQSEFEGLAAHFARVDLTLVGLHDQSPDAFELPAEIVKELKSGSVSERLSREFGRQGRRLKPGAQIDTMRPGETWVIRDGANEDLKESEPQYVVRRSNGAYEVSSAEGELVVEDRVTLEPRVVEPSVPFHPEWLSDDESRRARLAAWVTHPQNRRFERAIVNRVWGLLFGRPFLSDRPVDDLPSPEQEEYAKDTAVLDLLGRDFRRHNCDLRRLVQVIAATQAFRRESRVDEDEDQIDTWEELWAVFPLVRLRPEQVIGSMLQANSVKTIDQNSHLFVRFLRFVRETDFVRDFGDPGENELADRSGTIPQALLRMNGEFANEMSAENPLTAPARIARFSGTDEKLLENAFLACLTRRPSEEELGYFLDQLQHDDEQPEGIVQDIFWTLFNSPEFSWNH